MYAIIITGIRTVIEHIIKDWLCIYNYAVEKKVRRLTAVREGGNSKLRVSHTQKIL